MTGSVVRGVSSMIATMTLSISAPAKDTPGQADQVAAASAMLRTSSLPHRDLAELRAAERAPRAAPALHAFHDKQSCAGSMLVS